MEKKKTGVAVLIADKIDFKTKAIVRDKQDMMIKRTRKNNPPKHLRTQHRRTYICKANLDGHKGTD